MYHVRIAMQREDDSGKVMERFERETLINDNDVDALVLGAMTSEQFMIRHFRHLIWGMLVREREERAGCGGQLDGGTASGETVISLD